MKESIRQEIVRYVANYQNERQAVTAWLTPIIGFASTDDPLFADLKIAVSKSHAMPGDFLPGAQTVIAFFLPFDRSVAESNTRGFFASHEWETAYIETNTLIEKISSHIKIFLESHGYETVTIPPTHNFDKVRLISNWSHRHVAYIAGLGNFGINNMLITEQGCCGRLGSFVTNISISPDKRSETDACLYLHDGSCGKCVEQCVNGALFSDRFDRHACYEMLNRHEENSQPNERADVCGKCLVGIPCSFIDPVKEKLRSLHR